SGHESGSKAPARGVLPRRAPALAGGGPFVRRPRRVRGRPPRLGAARPLRGADGFGSRAAPGSRGPAGAAGADGASTPRRGSPPAPPPPGPGGRPPPRRGGPAASAPPA